MKLKMCSRRPGGGEVNSACHVAYGELIRLRAENTLSTVDRGHREMISIMKAFNSSAGVEKNRFEKRAVVFCWAPAMMGDACKVCCQLNALSSYINSSLFPRREKKKCLLIRLISGFLLLWRNDQYFKEAVTARLHSHIYFYKIREKHLIKLTLDRTKASTPDLPACLRI